MAITTRFSKSKPDTKIRRPDSKASPAHKTVVRSAALQSGPSAQHASSNPLTSSQPELLHLQSQYGLRAVQRLIQRAEAEQSRLETAATLEGGSAPKGGDISGGFQSQVDAARGGGQPLDRNVKEKIGGALGADFSKVKVHTDSKSDTLNRSISAQAFTTGSDVFFSQGAYNPGTPSGLQLLAHELTHVAQQGGTANKAQTKLTVGPASDKYESEADRIATQVMSGSIQRQANLTVQQHLPANRISTKKTMKHLDFVRMKRSNTHIKKMLLNKLGIGKKPEDAYGHWWTEIGDLVGDNWQDFSSWKAVESYGWWPSKKGMQIGETLSGVPGVVNSTEHGGNATEDPHHGEQAKHEFHPVMEVDANADYETVRANVINRIRSFAKGFKGSWNWRLGWGKNCHTFQQRLKSALGLHFQKGNGWLKRPTGASFHQDDALEYKMHEEDDAKERKRPNNQIRIALDYYDADDNLLGQFPAGTKLQRALGSTEDMIEVGTENADFYWVKKAELAEAIKKQFHNPPQGEVTQN